MSQSKNNVSAGKVVDKNYCMSSYLSFRYVGDENINFFEGVNHRNKPVYPLDKAIPCATSDDIDKAIHSLLDNYVDNETALLLSGGIDSAILAAYMPRGTKAYTMKCIADGAIDETGRARLFAEKYGLDHQIVEIRWEDYLESAPILMKHKGAPIHSIENRLYKVAMQARRDGIKKLVIGESADLVFGGMDRLLSRDWTFDEFVERYTFVPPAKVLKEPVSMVHVFEPFRRDGNMIDFVSFMENVFNVESGSSYFNTFTLTGFDYNDPYEPLVMSVPLDLNRVRNGDPKYLVRELFAKKYPGMEIPNKIPMPRAVDQWLKEWQGPTREEFIPGCVEGMTGDQRWLIFCLEMFLNLHDQGKI